MYFTTIFLIFNKINAWGGGIGAGPPWGPEHLITDISILLIEHEL